MLSVDTNVLVYAEGVGDPGRQSLANRILDAVPRCDFILPVQVVGELFRVLSRKTRLSRAAIRERLAHWEALSNLAPTMESTVTAALDVSVHHHLQVFDAIILAASAEAGCRMLLSEDMGDGFVWRGVTVVNPFAKTPHPLLADLLRP